MIDDGGVKEWDSGVRQKTLDDYMDEAIIAFKEK